ncbi:hypothetical protein BT96DRAFT_1015362 [Gymnopus androsaceus JB14]|uniref:Uncharacterized protein n=1 Tax=Gymnopus androsaceus JB14 TaxID=1447944 RepID=A0A6A4I7S4_9AGAR|nr:hypothetical protein BT96DRAFT_1015362 [Gymnopus androsaceus JB14]
MNVSSSTLTSQHSHSGSSFSNASGMLRFDEVYSKLSQVQNNRSSGGDYFQTSYENFSGIATPDAVGLVALSLNDIQKRVSGANGSLSRQSSARSNGKAEDVFLLLDLCTVMPGRHRRRKLDSQIPDRFHYFLRRIKDLLYT